MLYYKANWFLFQNKLFFFVCGGADTHIDVGR